MNKELDIQKIGSFIHTLRTDRQLTQKNLGDMLGVTNKAVSKWERGTSFPDISLLPQIANVFDVTIEEIINGEYKSAELSYQEEIQDVVTKTMEYSSTSFNIKKKKIMLMSLSILVFSTCLFNFIINILLNKSIIDTLYLNGAILSLFFTIIPIIFNSKHMVEKSLIIFLLSLLAYIYIILYFYKSLDIFLPLALPIAFVSCFSLYVIIKLFLHFRKNYFYAFSLTLIALGIGPLFFINTIVMLNGIERSDDISQSVILPLALILSIFLFICGFLKNKNTTETKALISK